MVIDIKDLSRPIIRIFGELSLLLLLAPLIVSKHQHSPSYFIWDGQSLPISSAWGNNGIMHVRAVQLFNVQAGGNSMIARYSTTGAAASALDRGTGLLRGGKPDSATGTVPSYTEASGISPNCGLLARSR